MVFCLFCVRIFFKQNKLSLFLRIGTIGGSVFLRIKGCLNNVLQSAWIVPPLSPPIPGKFLRFVSFFLSLVPACSSEIPRIPPPRLMSKGRSKENRRGWLYTPLHMYPKPNPLFLFSIPPPPQQSEQGSKTRRRCQKQGVKHRKKRKFDFF